MLPKPEINTNHFGGRAQLNKELKMKPKCAKTFEKLPTKLTKVGPTGGAENARRENDGPSCRT